jgi:class 3 adenylate cyclase
MSSRALSVIESSITHEPGEKQQVIADVTCSAMNDGRISMVMRDTTHDVNIENHLVEILEAERTFLQGMFPKHVLDYVSFQKTLPNKNDLAYDIIPHLHRASSLATRHDQITVLFADIVGFTPMCTSNEPSTVMYFLNDIFSRFDTLLDVYGVYKVETIGDCYVVAGGLVTKDTNGITHVRQNTDALNALKIVQFAKAMLKECRNVKMPGTEKPVSIRIGIHTGPVMSGIVGNRMPRFCLFGDTINTAARMESVAQPGSICATECTRLLASDEDWIHTGCIDVKGKGVMQTYGLNKFLNHEDNSLKTGINTMVNYKCLANLESTSKRSKSEPLCILQTGMKNS